MYRASQVLNRLRLLSVASLNGRLKSTIPPPGAKSLSSPLAKDSFLNGSNAVFIDSLYDQWRADEESVDPSWRKYFSESSYGIDSTVTGTAEQLSVNETVTDHLKVQSLIRCYQHLGHHIAALDPLNLYNADLDPSIPLELKLPTYISSEEDLQRYFTLPKTTQIGGDVKTLKLQEIYDRLRRIYCGSIGVEYMHITDPKTFEWIRDKFETPGITDLSQEDKLKVLRRLLKSVGFENFLNQKWSTEKRFGSEGCEVIAPALQEIVDRSAQLGVDNFIVGMSHRGRLNVIANVAKQPLAKIFSRFKKNLSFHNGTGDVKYHLGMFTNTYNEAAGKDVTFTMAANPSHLEAVNPIVQGRTHAEQFFHTGDNPEKKVMGILVHGDAAFAGQGVVYETVQLSNVDNYSTGGTVHIVVNNQIGFTTDPRNGRSSSYCTDVAKVVNAPIFHVNADDPEAVVYASRVAAEYRDTFQKDIFIDLVCYRRYGHNEMDNPEFTHPAMYRAIKTKPGVLSLYVNKLVKEGVCTREEYKQEAKRFNNACKEAAEIAENQTSNDVHDWISADWKSFLKSSNYNETMETGVRRDVLNHVGDAFCSVPKHITVHNTLKGVLMKRKQLLDDGKADWAMGEAMAFGSLLKENVHVRLSGQDVERGTFSHRHHILHHQSYTDIDGKIKWNILDNLFDDQGRYTISNSILSEYGVLGFETGYSIARPNMLVCWEAQFGDFHNCAQPIIDQFICSGQEKWGYQTGIVLLLPHGYEGMGPEHSSARLERFLQLCNDDMDVIPVIDESDVIKQLHDHNMQVVNCSTPANYFHVLRRQVSFNFRKPLVIMTPKSLLRLPAAVSSLDEMGPGTSFQRVIPETGEASEDSNCSSVKRVILCSGKMYYDLHSTRKSKGLEKEIAIARIEQLFPFPYDMVQKEIEKFPNADIVWCQEEPKNMGAWAFVQPRVYNITGHLKLPRYVGRKPSGSVAAGTKKDHDIQQAELLAEALDVD
ncbi:uncharacterized protein TRIADDRAFT_23841 [Trichoplax adhaerens]|uniref:2-oxoglutarate dehydrogenase, mitochondrial n=1 Tax=Trichoplax adhaerens TaxID=10228 RepID=B3RW26_TRIAD|nr:hypothetical protein TRIADDRAFT_23841 [Trichoplax adhaerens]EDV25596.1 hypothetical protein TRIADDRAFT_23841 [Trichoplax adhaerens]|eukprot:XP_002111629.1 hypothetical protein TRIADDRAFT_23841 [Trichoplax adhaerens]